MSDTNKYKVAVILLTLNRKEMLKRVIEESLPKAGCDFDLFIVDNGSTEDGTKEYIASIQGAFKIFLPENTGTSNGLNYGIKMAYELGYDYFQLCANDILEPENWIINKIRYMNEFPNSGMVSISPGAEVISNNNMTTPRYCHVIGQFMINRQVIDKLGFLSNRYSKLYHPMDCDLNSRCEKLGFKNYYLPNNSSQHISGNHGGENSNPEYGYIKNDHLATTWGEYIRFKDNQYSTPQGCYIPFEPTLSFSKPYFKHNN